MGISSVLHTHKNMAQLLRRHNRGFLLALEQTARGFPGGTVLKNPPANAGDTGSSPGPGRSHMPWSN